MSIYRHSKVQQETVHAASQLASLRFQQQLLVRELGRLFPASVSPESIERILDVACGPSVWLLGVAKAFPHLHLTGIDSSQFLINASQEDAYVAGVQHIDFAVHTFNEPLPYTENSFDYIHALRSNAEIEPGKWPGVMSELVRVARPAGCIHLLDCEIGPTSSSSVNRFLALLYEAHKRAGRVNLLYERAFTSAVLYPQFLHAAGCINVSYQLHAINLDNQYGFVGRDYIMAVLTEDRRTAYYLTKMQVATMHEVDVLLRDMRFEIQQRHFCGAAMLVSATGTKPGALS